MAKFGIGQPVRRVEDQRFLTGQGRYVDDIVLPGMAARRQRAVAARPRQDQEIDVAKAKAAPGVLLVLTGADVVADKIGALTSHLMPEDFGAPKGHRTFQPLLGHRPRAPRRRPRRLRRRRDAGAGARRRRAGRGRLRAAAGAWSTSRTPPSPTRVKVWDDNPAGNNAFRLMFGNKEATDAAFAERQARRQAPRREQPAVARLDGAARRHRRLQRRDRRDYTLYAASQNPHGARMEVSHIFHVPENRIRVVSPDVGGGFGLKGGFFPEDGLVDVGGAQAPPAGEVGLDPQREHAQRSSRPRDGLLRRARARRARQDPRRCARKSPVPDGRLFRRRGARRRRVLDPLRAGRLRHPDHAHHVAGRVHQHLAERAVSRRRPARRPPISWSG